MPLPTRSRRRRRMRSPPTARMSRRKRNRKAARRSPWTPERSSRAGRRTSGRIGSPNPQRPGRSPAEPANTRRRAPRARMLPRRIAGVTPHRTLLPALPLQRKPPAEQRSRARAGPRRRLRLLQRLWQPPRRRPLSRVLRRLLTPQQLRALRRVERLPQAASAAHPATARRASAGSAGDPSATRISAHRITRRTVFGAGLSLTVQLVWCLLLGSCLGGATVTAYFSGSHADSGGN